MNWSFFNSFDQEDLTNKERDSIVEFRFGDV